jgi:putative membrane protein
MMGISAMSWFWIWPTLVVIGLVLLGHVAYRIAGGRGTDRSPARTGSACWILDACLARGEIEVDDYRRRIELL